MLKIGDFSQLAQVSVRALRIYDEMGLLKPVHVDRFSGYRYYEAEQLPRLNRIIALKDLGLTLDQIAQLLKDDLSAEQLRGMLMMKQADLEQELKEGKSRLMRVAARLRPGRGAGDRGTGSRGRRRGPGDWPACRGMPPGGRGGGGPTPHALRGTSR